MVSIAIRQICYHAPVRYEGTVDRYALYFRARHAEWHPTIPSMDGRYVRSADYGPGGQAASFMDDHVTQGFIERCLAEYLDGMRGEFQGEPPSLPPEPPAPLPLVWDQETFTTRGQAPGDVNATYFERRDGSDGLCLPLRLHSCVGSTIISPP
jgi:hypothetical protein